MPGVLKNALDWASRAPERALNDKPVAIVGATPGRWGTVRSQLALRQMLLFPGCRVMPAPVLTIAGAREHFDADGNLTDAETRAQLVGRPRGLRDLDPPGRRRPRGAAGFLDIWYVTRYIVTNRYLSRSISITMTKPSQATQDREVQVRAHDRERRPRRASGEHGPAASVPGGHGHGTATAPAGAVGRRTGATCVAAKAASPGFLGRGPRAGRGDVRAAILALLAEQPMHGYQIMRELGERSGGVWRPSPGSIYPTLQQLEDEELVRPETGDGGRRVFALTDAGREAQSAAAGGPAPWDEVGAEGDTTALELRDLVGQVMGAARQVLHAGESAQIAQAKDVLRDARRKLYRILAEDSPEPSDAAPAEPDQK